MPSLLGHPWPWSFSFTVPTGGTKGWYGGHDSCSLIHSCSLSRNVRVCGSVSHFWQFSSVYHLSYLQSCSKVGLKHCHKCPWLTTPHLSACVAFCILTHSLSLRWPVVRCRCWLSLSFSCLTCRNVANGECVGRWGTDDWERRRRRGGGQTDRWILVNVLGEWMNVWKIVNCIATQDWMAPCALSLCAYVCTCKISLEAERKLRLRWGGGVIKMFLLMVSCTYRKDGTVVS